MASLPSGREVGARRLVLVKTFLMIRIQRWTKRKSTTALTLTTSDCNNYDVHLYIDKTMLVGEGL